jgi:hypothetical protein
VIRDEKNLVSEEAPTFYDDVEAVGQSSVSVIATEIVRGLEKGCTELALGFRF